MLYSFLSFNEHGEHSSDKLQEPMLTVFLNEYTSCYSAVHSQSCLSPPPPAALSYSYTYIHTLVLFFTSDAACLCVCIRQSESRWCVIIVFSKPETISWFLLFFPEIFFCIMLNFPQDDCWFISWDFITHLHNDQPHLFHRDKKWHKMATLANIPIIMHAFSAENSKDRTFINRRCIVAASICCWCYCVHPCGTLV